LSRRLFISTTFYTKHVMLL